MTAPLPDLQGWALFAAVTDAGSIAGAADALCLSKATVSKGIARLEARLATPLFHRTSRRLTLTPSGAALADRARRILGEARAAEEAAQDSAAALAGPIRVTAPTSFGLRHVAPVVADWLAERPGTRIELALSDARVDLVAEGFDVAFRIGALPDSTLRARRLCAVPLLTVAAPRYLHDHGRPGAPAELGNHRCLLYTAGGAPDPWRFAGRDGPIAIRPDGPLWVDNGDAMLPLLRAGGGIAQLPGFIVGDDVRRGRLVQVLPDWPVPPLALHLVTPPGAFRPARVDAFLRFAAERLRRREHLGGEGA